MKSGKLICETLKTLRKHVAEANGIEYNPEKCIHKGNCPGSCPKCDAELEELTRQLEQLKAEGRDVKIPELILADFLANITEEEKTIDEEEVLAGMPALPPDYDFNEFGDDPMPGMRGTDVSWKEIEEWKARHPENNDNDDEDDEDDSIMPLQGDICAPDSD